MRFYSTNHTKKRPPALKIAGKGIPVFPCKPDKRPYTPRGFKDATTNPGHVNGFWTRYPEALIGVPTGEASGFFVVDVDRLEALGELPRELPETLTIRTRSGGLHYYFKHELGLTNRTGGLPAGIDIRGEGGYVIVPPSEGYRVERRAPVADAPPWLLEMLREKPARIKVDVGRDGATNIKLDDSFAGPIPDGARDETLTRIGGRLHDGTRDLSQLEDDLQAINEARCAPPLPPEQVRKIARSIWRYEPCRPERRGPDREISAALAEIEASILRREWKGKGGKTRYSIAVSALKIARQFGARVEGGVRVEVSARQLALAAATSRSSIMRNLKMMGDVLRPDNEGVSEGKAGAIVLLTPPARTDTTLTTERVVSTDEGGCVSSRSPLSAPRLRWSSPVFKRRRGLVNGTSKVRNAPVPEIRAAVIRLGKSCERVMDTLEASGGSMTLSALASAVDVKRPRDLTRRKNLETGKGRDGFVARLEDVGVVEVADGLVTLTEDWQEALDRERERSGEIDLYRRDMARYNRERGGYRNRNKVKADPAPTQEEMKEARESYPARRREAITTALTRLFAERPEYRGRRAGQVSCMLPWYLPAPFPRGPDGAPKDAEVEAILDGEAVA